MEVGTITNNITIPKINLNNLDLPESDAANSAINADVSSSAISTNAQFDYNEAMMDLQEVQDFLFMLIGEEVPGTSGKGGKLNLFA